MQVNPQMVAKYQAEAPELLEAVTSGEAQHIMKRDPETDYCIKFQNGLCSVHASRGTEFIGDACHFYPRITRQYDDVSVMGGAMSCPETVRLMLKLEKPFSLVANELTRLPEQMKQYAPDGVAAADALKVMDAFVNLAGNEEVPVARALSRILSVAESLSRTDVKSWQDGIQILLIMAEGGLPQLELDEHGWYGDMARLAQTLAGLIHAAKTTARPRLDDVCKNIHHYLGIKLEPETLDILQIQPDAADENTEMEWFSPPPELEHILRCWLQGQLVMMGFPYSGFGENARQRAQLLAVRFATVKLALMAVMREQGQLTDEVAVAVIQPLARFTDHLAEPELSVALYQQAGWHKVSRLRSLIGDNVL